MKEPWTTLLGMRLPRHTEEISSVAGEAIERNR